MTRPATSTPARASSSSSPGRGTSRSSRARRTWSWHRSAGATGPSGSAWRATARWARTTRGSSAAGRGATTRSACAGKPPAWWTSPRSASCRATAPECSWPPGTPTPTRRASPTAGRSAPTVPCGSCTPNAVAAAGVPPARCSCASRPRSAAPSSPRPCVSRPPSRPAGPTRPPSAPPGGCRRTWHHARRTWSCWTARSATRSGRRSARRRGRSSPPRAIRPPWSIRSGACWWSVWPTARSR